MLKYTTITFGLITTLILSSCSTGTEENIRPYYFQMKDFKDSKVYIYENDENSNLHFYGEMKYHLEHGDTIFVSTNLDDNFNVTNVFSELVDKDHAILLDYVDIVEGNEINTNILKDVVFNFSGGQSLWSVGYSDYHFDLLSKIRLYNGQKATYNFKGKNIETIIIEDEVTVTDKSPHNSTTETYHYKTYYGKGLGIVKIESMDFPESCWHLVDIKTLEELNLIQ